MNILKKFTLIIIGILIQASVFNLLTIENVKPDILLVIVICISLIYGAEQGMLFGFLSGLSEDILLGGILGMNAFVKTIIGFFIGISNEKLFGVSTTTQIIITFFATVLEGGIVYLILSIFQYNVSAFGNFLYVIFLSAFYNILLVIIIFPKINKW
ncbi:MAG: rod shape-determining protein MreD [Candidatus Firestonebacteria bacterium]|nr:rod shape-determining protein MreD [Candidatus Firestonebacteria bacterium]